MKIVISTTVNMPIYEQIVNQIRDAVIRGELKKRVCPRYVCLQRIWLSA